MAPSSQTGQLKTDPSRVLLPLLRACHLPIHQLIVRWEALAKRHLTIRQQDTHHHRKLREPSHHGN
ncbi:hypothetical protein ACHAXS_003625 [Conticribra weissflogii]